MPVINELKEITKMTKHEKALNDKIASGFSLEDQKHLFDLVQDMIFDELVYVMTLIKMEKSLKADIKSEA